MQTGGPEEVGEAVASPGTDSQAASAAGGTPRPGGHTRHGLWGWIGHPGTGQHADPAGILTRTGARAADTLTWQDAALASSAWGGGTPLRINDLLIGWCGRPWSRDAEALTPAELARWIAERYRQSGSALLERLSGPFALAILDPAAGSGLVAVDRIGVHEVAYAHTAGGLLFGPRADALALAPGVDAAVDSQAIYDYLYHHVVPRPATVYRGVRCLRPGEALRFARGQVETRAYWRPRFHEHEDIGIAALQEEFRRTVRGAVARAAASGRVGAFLSGGTDSSTILGMLGEVTGAPPRAYSIGFDAPGYDETDYARIAARHYGAQAREYYVTPGDVAAAIPAVAAAFDQPYGNASVVPAYYCSRLAHDDGTDVLLGGDGGDELFAGNARYARQWILSLYDHVPALLRRGVIEPATRLPGWGALPPLRKIARYVEQARLPFPDRYETYNLLEHIGPANVFTAEFLEAVDTRHPLADMGREFEDFSDAALLNRMLGVDLKFTLADDDLRKVTHAGEMAGVETRFPFLDDSVVELAARIPPRQKLRRTRLRHFFKEALADYLPREILTKEKHGFGLPFGEWLRTDAALKALARDSLDGLRSRGIVRPAMIDELTSTRLEQHAGYFGTLTWVLMMLEQWYRHGARTE